MKYLCFAIALLFIMPSSASDRPVNWVADPTCQTIFHAVLEGLYTDGVSNDDVDCILAPDPKTKEPRLTEHFVYACPLCHPAFEAFRLYRMRPLFYGLKGKHDTFGKGLDAAMSVRLHDPEKFVRLGAIQELISRWVGRRLDMMNLSVAERGEWRARLADRAKMGIMMLDSQRDLYKGWKTCAICAGSQDAGDSQKSVKPPTPPFEKQDKQPEF